MALARRFHEEPNCVHFKESWIPMVYTVVMNVIVFNWVAFLSYTLRSALDRDNKPPTRTYPMLYMAFYLLDVLFISKVSMGMNWN